MKKNELKEKIIKEGEKGNIIILTIDGLAVINLDDFIKQPIEGILYDLNRLPEVILTHLDDPKWINDYAISLIIARLKQKLEEK